MAFCTDYRCSHLVRLSRDYVDRWPDDPPISDIEPRFVCGRAAGPANLRPDFPPLWWEP